MLRSVSIVVAAAMAAGALTFTPAAAAPVRALPQASQPAAGAIQDVRDRRERRLQGHWRDDDRYRAERWRHHRERRHHRRFVPAPFFHYGFPYFVPPRHHQFFVSPRQRHHWHGRSGRH
jgi:hypothetical protein